MDEIRLCRVHDSCSTLKEQAGHPGYSSRKTAESTQLEPLCGASGSVKRWGTVKPVHRRCRYTYECLATVTSQVASHDPGDPFAFESTGWYTSYS